jgi:hypothetical protein
MILRKRTSKRKTHRLMVRVIIPGQTEKYAYDGRQIVDTEWIELDEIDLGSVNKPNSGVIEIKLVPKRDDDGT